MRVLDIDGFHPNIQEARSLAKVFTYCSKEGDYLTNKTRAQLDAYKRTAEPKEAKRSVICQALLDGASLKTVVEKHPEALYDLKRYAENLALWRLLSAKPYVSPHKRGIWIWGLP